MPKKIRIVYYALLRHERGLAEEVIDSTAATLGDLFDELKQRHHFKLTQSQVRAAVNAKIAPWDTLLNQGDAVLFIPPVAGG